MLISITKNDISSYESLFVIKLDLFSLIFLNCYHSVENEIDHNYKTSLSITKFIPQKQLFFPKIDSKEMKYQLQ